MIDTEPKVLKPFLKNPPSWLDTQNVKYFEHGRGNNWSYGYLHSLPNQPINDPSLDFLNSQNKNLNKKNEGHEQKIFKQFSHNNNKINNHSLLSLYLQENKTICDYVLDRARKEL